MGSVLRVEIRKQILLGFFTGKDNANVESYRIKAMKGRKM